MIRFVCVCWLVGRVGGGAGRSRIVSQGRPSRHPRPQLYRGERQGFPFPIGGSRDRAREAQTSLLTAKGLDSRIYEAVGYAGLHLGLLVQSAGDVLQPGLRLTPLHSARLLAGVRRQVEPRLTLSTKKNDAMQSCLHGNVQDLVRPVPRRRKGRGRETGLAWSGEPGC